MTFRLGDELRQLNAQKFRFSLAGAIGERGLVGHGGSPGAHELLQPVHGFACRRRGGRIEARAKQRQHARVDPIGLGERANRLGEQSRRSGLTTATGRPAA